MEKELRKRQSLLVEAGAGVILFAIWSLTRSNLFLALSPLTVEDLYNAAEKDGLDKDFFVVAMIIIVGGIMLSQLIVRLYIGLSATAEGKGRPKGWFYLVLTAMTLVTDLQIFWQSLDVEGLLSGEQLSVSMIVAICIEAASMYILLEVLVFGIWVKVLRKKMKV